MSHPLAAHRDAINALIGPLEESKANLIALMTSIRESGWDASANFLQYITIGEAIDDLSNKVSEIDEWIDEPEEAEPVEDDEAEPDPDEDEDDDTDGE